MSELMTRLIREAAALPPAEQDALVTRWLDDLHSDLAWNQSFARSQDALAKMATEALAEHAAGLTQTLEPDRL